MGRFGADAMSLGPRPRGWARLLDGSRRFRRISSRRSPLHRHIPSHHAQTGAQMPTPDPKIPSMIRFLTWSSDESRSVLAKLLEDLYGTNVICRSN
jgi:hypothetical protein